MSTHTPSPDQSHATGTYGLLSLTNARRYALRPGANSVGRERGNDIVVSDHQVSRRHCTVTVHATGCEVEDAGSRNGTRVNGCRVGRAPLGPGDILEIGERRLQVTRTAGADSLTGPVHAPFDDEVLGRVYWNPEDSCWNFDAGPIGGRPLVARYVPADSGKPAEEYGWDRVRACVVWLRGNEPVVSERARRLCTGWCQLTGLLFFPDQDGRLVFSGSAETILLRVNVSEGSVSLMGEIRHIVDWNDETQGGG